MLVNHTYKFIFVHVPKTGGRALTHVLQQACHQDPGEYWRGTRPDPVQGGRKRIDPCHYTCDLLKSERLSEYWDDYYKFAVVRDPFARYLSAVAMVGGFKKHPYLHPSILVPEYRNAKKVSQTRQHRYTRVRPMCVTLSEPIDQIFRFETMEEMIEQLEKRFSVSLNFRPHKNKLGTNIELKREIARALSDEDVELLKEFNGKDYELYEYPFIDWRKELLVDD